MTKEAAGREDILRTVATAMPVAWAEQVHSARVLVGRAGRSGQGDALVCGDGGLALSVMTADCVPVLIAAGSHVAAIHAGWRDWS